MKKFKFFALAALFGMSINAMAQTEKSTDTFTYTVDGDNNATITGFVNGLSASKMATVTIPATIKGTKSTDVYPVVAIDGTASKSTKFSGNASIKKVVLAASSNLETIYACSFQGAKNLATVTLTNGKKLKEIEPAAFDGTAITTLDLTPTIITKLEPIFTDVMGGTKNKKITTVKLPAKLKSIEPYAFSKCQQLATVDFKKCSAALTIGGYAFDNCLFFSELELPACLVRIADGALEGSRIETLTINANSKDKYPTIGEMGGAKLTSIVVKGAFQGKFGIADDETTPVTVSTSVKSVTFEGAVKKGALAEGSFVYAANLANVTFKSTLDVDAVAEGAFGDDLDYAGSGLPVLYGWMKQYLTVTYAPEEGNATKVKSINQKAFASDGSWGKRAVLSTATWYKSWIESKYTGKVIFSVDIQAAPETLNIEVANNGEGKYFYAAFCEEGRYKIAAEQNGGKVMVYSAYVDEITNDGGNTFANQVYMEQLSVIGGCYWIPANTAVIVKSTTSEDVVAELAISGGANSMHYQKSSTETTNAIQVTKEDLYGVELKEAVESAYGSNKYVPYILAPIEDYGMQWTKFKDTRNIAKGTFYVVANNLSAEYPARLNIVWTDGSEEEATAIKTVKKANAENGAQFNLAGQKVNAAYKGIIIKDGKKMIQK